MVLGVLQHAHTEVTLNVVGGGRDTASVVHSKHGVTARGCARARAFLPLIFPRLRGQGDYAANAADCARNSNSMGLT